jgi:hypothetical protein
VKIHGKEKRKKKKNGVLDFERRFTWEREKEKGENSNDSAFK